MTVAEGYRTWRGFLSSDDASPVAYPELTVQPFRDFHRRPGIAGAFRHRQQLEGAQLEPHRVVPVHLPAVFETQDLFQARLRVQRPERWLGALWGNAEAPVEPRHKPIEHSLCLLQGGCTSQPQFGDQPVLKGPSGSLNTSLGLGRLGEVWVIISSMARLNWVGPVGRPDPGVCLNTAWRSV